MDELINLLRMPTVSGSEYKYSEPLKKLMSKYCDSVYDDIFGNVYGICGNGKKKILIDAHVDIIGLMVTNIEKDGAVSFTTVGGVDDRILPSMNVVIHGRNDIKGVIGVPPPHLQSGDSSTPYSTESLKIDTGLTKEELSKIVETGDFVSFDSQYTELLNNRIAMNGLDNKVGLYCALEVAKHRIPDDITLVIVASVGEEINLNGARIAANSNEFELAVVIDVTHGTTHDSADDYTFPLGSGPAIAVGPGLSEIYSDMLENCALKSEIPYSIEVTNGHTGTNSLAYEVNRAGILCAVVSVPLRYMHTAYEVVEKTDISNTVKLLGEFIKSCSEVNL